MKKILVILGIVLCSLSVSAQSVDGYGIPSNSLNVEISDGIGEGFVAVFAEITGAVISAMFGQTSSTELVGWIPYVSVGYDYHFADTRWSVGGDIGYWHIGMHNKNDGTTIDYNVGTIAATGKFWYKPNGCCKLYGGLAGGVGINGNRGGSEESPVQFFPAFQLNPIGMRLGNERVAFLAELGIGYKGILQLGINIGL